MQWGIANAGGFEGNAQSFRLATAILSHHGADRGLQLTHATLDACLKYPWTPADADAPHATKWSVYPTEQSVLDQVRAAAPTELRYVPTLEAQVMDWADDVAYSIHDLEDWYRAGYMHLPRLATDPAEQDRFVDFVIERWRSRQDHRADDADALSERIRRDVLGADGPLNSFQAAASLGERIDDPDSGAARRAVRRLRATVFDAAMTQVAVYRRGDAALDAPRRYIFGFEPDESVRFTVDILKELLWFYVVPDVRIATMQHGQQATLADLFRQHIHAIDVGEFRMFPAERAELLRRQHDGRERLRLVADYISGLTDSGARRLHERLRSGGERLHDYL